MNITERDLTRLISMARADPEASLHHLLWLLVGAPAERELRRRAIAEIERRKQAA